MATRMIEGETEKPRTRVEELPQVSREQTLYHPVDALTRCAEHMKTPSESTHATPQEAQRSWEISSRVSEIPLECGTPLHERFKQLLDAVE